MLVKTCLYLVIGLLMVGIVRVVAFVNVYTLIKILLEVLAGAVVFGCVCIVYWKKTNNQFFVIVCQPIIQKFKR